MVFDGAAAFAARVLDSCALVGQSPRTRPCRRRRFAAATARGATPPTATALAPLAPAPSQDHWRRCSSRSRWSRYPCPASATRWCRCRSAPPRRARSRWRFTAISIDPSGSARCGVASRAARCSCCARAALHAATCPKRWTVGSGVTGEDQAELKRPLGAARALPRDFSPTLGFTGFRGGRSCARVSSKPAPRSARPCSPRALPRLDREQGAQPQAELRRCCLPAPRPRRTAYRYQLQGLLERAGLTASMVADVKAGHTYDDPVASLIQAEWPSLVHSILTE